MSKKIVSYPLPLFPPASGIRKPSVVVTGRRVASGYFVLPFSGTHIIFPSKTEIGQNESSVDFFSPNISNMGTHSQVAETFAVWEGKFVAHTIIETTPPLSIVTNESSLLNPAHSKLDSLLIEDIGPFEITLAVIASINRQPIFWVPSCNGSDS